MKILMAPLFVMSAASHCLALLQLQLLLLLSLLSRLHLLLLVARSARLAGHLIQLVNRSVQTAALCSVQRLMQTQLQSWLLNR